MSKGESQLQECLDKARKSLDRFTTESLSSANNGIIDQELYKLLTALAECHSAQLEALQIFATGV